MSNRGALIRKRAVKGLYVSEFINLIKTQSYYTLLKKCYSMNMTVIVMIIKRIRSMTTLIVVAIFMIYLVMIII